jgi:hypothetical protein
MYSGTGNTTSLVLGFPIRTSSDQRSVDSSPRLIAASYVLHRLSMPRHPPCALKHLQHKKPKMSKNCTSTQHKTHPQKRRHASCCVRCSQPLSTNQTPHPTTKWSGNKLTTTPDTGDGTHRPGFPTGDEGRAGLLPQSPIVCLAVAPPQKERTPKMFVVHQNRTHYR